MRDKQSDGSTSDDKGLLWTVSVHTQQCTKRRRRWIKKDSLFITYSGRKRPKLRCMCEASL
jgi:hypothetical protein